MGTTTISSRSRASRIGMLHELSRGSAFRRHRLAVAASLCAGLIGGTWVGAGLPPVLLHNTSDSVPVGWYVWVPGAPVAKGAVVRVADPPHYPLGWLLKRVVGTGGDSFCWDQDLGTHRLNGRPMPPPLSYAVEVMHVPVWKGCEVLRPGEVVGYGDTPDSYDGRYLGPTESRHLSGVYRLAVRG